MSIRVFRSVFLVCCFLFAFAVSASASFVPKVSFSPDGDGLSSSESTEVSEIADGGLSALSPDGDGDDSAIDTSVKSLASGNLSGGYYFTADCAFGSGLRFYVPAEFAEDSLTFDSSGDIVNLSNSSVYLYCPSYPSYFIYAPRFSTFQYRVSTGSSYGYSDCDFSNVESVTVSFLKNADKPVVSVKVLLLCLITVVFLLGAVSLFVRRG